MSSYYTPEEADTILRAARAAIETADEALVDRRDPNAFENVNAFVQRQPEPEPERPPRTFTDYEVSQLIQRAAEDLRSALVEQREELTGWVEETLIGLSREFLDRHEDADDRITSVVGDVADTSIKLKGIENDIAGLRVDVDALRADMDSLRGVVEALARRVDVLADDISSVDRAGGKIINLRGAP